MPSSVRAWLIRLYPSQWRERNSVEFEAMLEQGLNSPLDVIDMMLGAFDAHLQLLNGENLSWRLINMLNKLRTNIMIVFAAYIGFIIAGMALVGMLDDSPMIPYMQTDIASTLAMDIIRASAVVALLAIVVGGLPLAVTMIRRALVAGHRNLALLLVPVVSFLVLVLYFGFVFLVATGQIHINGIVQVVQPGYFPLGNRLLLGGLMLIFVLGAIASTLAVWKAVSLTDDEQVAFHPLGKTVNIKIYKFAFIPAVIASISMSVILVATLVWSVLVFSALPQVLSADFGPWQTSTQAWLYGIIGLMLICSLASLFGIARGRPALADSCCLDYSHNFRRWQATT
jgi:hypothetical protein